MSGGCRAVWTLAVLLLLGQPAAWAQRPAGARPRLAVVIVVDQLRPDYLERFRPHLGSGGFNLLLRRGAAYPHARYAHAITSTCPGHAVVLTGSYAHVNGITANDWYDPVAHREVYCAEDRAERLVGAAGEGRSPRNLIGATVGDELELATNGAARVVSVAAKDRSAIMLGGHLADAAYWMHGPDFVTSTFYSPELPAWVNAFDAAGRVRAAMDRSWERLLPAEAYAAAGPDDEPAEGDESGMGRTFPHPIRNARAFDRSPFSDELVADFAMRSVTAEALGRDSVPDLLAIAFAANDRVGHAYGPDSHEVMDVLLRLDRTLERLFAFLDREVGLANVVMVLTADHGVAPMPEVLRRVRPGAAARRVHPDSITAPVTRALDQRYGAPGGDGWIAYHDFPHLSLDPRVLGAMKAPVAEAERIAAAAVAAVPGVREALTATDLARQRRDGVRTPATLSFYPGRGASVHYQLEPYLVVAGRSTGAEHGSQWAYDQQVPMLWFGWGVRPGVQQGPAEIADIAPTLSALLGLAPPGGSEGRVLREVLR